MVIAPKPQRGNLKTLDRSLGRLARGGMTINRHLTERTGLLGVERARRGAIRKLEYRVRGCDSISSVEGYGKSEESRRQRDERGCSIVFVVGDGRARKACAPAENRG